MSQVTEPNEAHWTDEKTGYECHILRVTHSGHLCGYVTIPEGHPLHGVGYNQDVPESLRAQFGHLSESPVGKRGAIDIFLVAATGKPTAGFLFDVHGGITYSDTQKDGAFWYGFDCSHAGDLCPKRGHAHAGDVYRDFEYVKAECASLASQLFAFAAVAA